MSVFVLAALVVIAAWWLPNRETAAPFPAGRLDSVSFAPYRAGQSPLTGVSPTSAELTQDMALVGPYFRAVRTYTALGPMAQVPALARAHGLKVWQGIWLGQEPAENARNIAAGIALADRYPDVIDRVIVGNEVLLRGDMTPAALIAAINAVRAQVRQPVAYAEVWQYWEKFPEVAAHVDQVLVHLLPFWEDRPLGIGRAVAEELDYYRRMQALFPGKPVIVGETGWPSLGRWRGDAAPGRVNEARYLRAFAAAAARQGIEYNVIEAFDQDWKAAQEGSVGAAWGVWTSDRTAKFPPGVPVLDDPAWRWHAGASVLLGLLLAVRRGRTPGNVVLSMALGSAMVWAWAGIVPSALGVERQGMAAIDLAAQGLLAWLLRGSEGRKRAMAALTSAFLIAALAIQVLLVLDPRYRDFPTAAFAVAVVAAVWRLGGGVSRDGLEALAAAALVAVAIAGAAQEGPANVQSLLWCAAALLLAAPPLAGALGAPPSWMPRAALPGAG